MVRAVVVASLLPMAALAEMPLSYLESNPAGNLEELFDEFKAKFGKVYTDPAEELQRFKVFTRNVERARRMNFVDEGSAKYGHLSPMADMSEHEFGEMNNLPVTAKTLREHAEAAMKATENKMLQGALTTSNFDWRDKGAVNKPKNQQQCGSCWSFATVANIEGNNYVTNGELVSLSEQELVDCDTMDNGCNGGLPSNAYKDLIGENMGLELESEYPYTAADGTCHAKKSLEKVYLSSWLPISSSEDSMAQAVMKYGPLAIGINAGPMQLYMGGIANPMFCDPSALDHGVAIVGFGEEGGKQFWVIRNSWGESWGESGYYRIIRGKGKCGLNRMVTTAIVKPSSQRLALPGTSDVKPELYV